MKVVFSSVGYENVKLRLHRKTVETKTLDVELVAGLGQLDEVIVTGTRSVGRTKLETASSVDVISIRVPANALTIG